MTAKRTYEGLFLLDAGQPDFEAASQSVRALLARYQADILSIKPWDERRLAYEIQGRRRGLYALTYFAVDPAHMSEIEHDCELSEQILRSMILHKEALTQEQINAETPVTSGASRVGQEEEEAPASEEEDRPSRRGEGEGRPRRSREAQDKDTDKTETSTESEDEGGSSKDEEEQE